MLVKETEQALKDLMKLDKVELLTTKGKIQTWFVCEKNGQQVILRTFHYMSNNKKNVSICELMTLENGKTIWYPRKKFINV